MLNLRFSRFYFQVAQTFGIDVLDMHYFFRHKTEMRVGDGVHWNAVAHRKMTNIILAHVSKAWGVKLPGRDRKQNMFMSPLDAKVSVMCIKSCLQHQPRFNNFPVTSLFMKLGVR